LSTNAIVFSVQNTVMGIGQTGSIHIRTYHWHKT